MVRFIKKGTCIKIQNYFFSETAHVQSFKANEDAAVSALFDEFKTPGFSVFEKSSSSTTTFQFVLLFTVCLHLLT